MLKDFLDELEALAQKHGVTIWACSCCQGVNICDSTHETEMLEFTDNKLTYSSITKIEG